MKKKKDKGNTIKKERTEKRAVEKRIAQSKEDFLEAYKKKWTITGAALAIGMNRKQYYEWIKEDKEFRIALGEVKKEHIDFAVSKLVGLLSDGNLGAIIYFLKCQSKKWSPMEKREISGKVETSVPQGTEIDEETKRALVLWRKDYDNKTKSTKSRDGLLDRKRKDKK